MFKFVTVFFLMMPGLALAAEKPPQCKPDVVNTHQVLVTGDYGGKPFSFTITNQSPLRPGQKPPPGEAADQPCPMTS